MIDTTPKSTTITLHKKGVMKLITSDHFLVNVIKRSLDLSGISELRSNLCRIKIGERIAVQVNNTVLIGERISSDEGVLVTGYLKVA